MVINLVWDKIDGELRRRRFVGTGEIIFTVELATEFPEMTREIIMEPYRKLWKRVWMDKIGGADGPWLFHIQGVKGDNAQDGDR